MREWSRPNPEATEGLTDPRVWGKSAFEFYTLEGATALCEALESFEGGKLLVTVPLNMGAPFVIDSGLGDNLGFIPVDKHTLRSEKYPEMFVLGDASSIPTSKAGAVAHFSIEVFVENFLELIKTGNMSKKFDGHATCFVESGRGKALLLDFNYTTEPLVGTYPYGGVGPFSLLKESRFNHVGKMSFEHVYWHMLLPGHKFPVPTEMSMSGKVPAEKTLQEG